MIRKFGLKRDKVDRRDLLCEMVSGVLPKKVDLHDECPPVYDQGHEGSCTAQAAVALFDFRKLKPATLSQCDYDPSSRQFVYYNERANAGTIDQDSGASLRDVIYSMSKVGVCPERLWPYDMTNMYLKPSEIAYSFAAMNKVSQYYRIVQAPAHLKSALAQGNPFIFGFSVYESFQSTKVAKTGIMPMPGEKEECLGGHEVMCVGYDESKQSYIVRNSWGRSWGDKGYFYMPYSYMHNPNLSFDMWTLHT